MPPANFSGDTPEEEYYTSQGVSNTKSYFTTPHGNLVTQSFIPLDQSVKAMVYMSHRYGSDTGWLFQKICIGYARWGYAMFAADLLGHGLSDGIRSYLGDMAKVAASSLSFFVSVRRREEYKGLPAFLFGESMKGLATMLMYFQSEADTWTGLIFSAPLFVIPENMKPSKHKYPTLEAAASVPHPRPSPTLARPPPCPPLIIIFTVGLSIALPDLAPSAASSSASVASSSSHHQPFPFHGKGLCLGRQGDDVGWFGPPDAIRLRISQVASDGAWFHSGEAARQFPDLFVTLCCDSAGRLRAVTLWLGDCSVFFFFLFSFWFFW
ncbi:hypothetical protein RHMOL_Rhmol05G0166600 [Rhododendron molle]|uniref:Uncharacterized protein n=1 Tax=Rhododendron molle TaxID=49168 RepID=A0ACC0NQQ7_RHOML|nr:hypothetical protein RHMOL_Rhmol05G0166600 [Rhododendron molle]